MRANRDLLSLVLAYGFIYRAVIGKVARAQPTVWSAGYCFALSDKLPVKGRSGLVVDT